MSKDISVIICAYTEKRWADLVAAIESIQRQTLRAREIIVVIDHNPPLLERVRARFVEVLLLENQETRGLAGARNTGIAAAQGSIVAFLDDDAIAAPDWLNCISIGYTDRHVLGVGGAIEPLWPGARPFWFPPEFDWVVGCTYRGLPVAIAPVRNLIGANMSFRREVFTKVRFYSGVGHNGSVPLGGSDPDFCIRVKQQWPQSVLLYQPRARVQHRVSRNRAQWRYFCLRCYNEGLSKSLITRRVGARDGLATERTYTLRTLPRGIIRGVLETVRHGNLGGISRACAIIMGFFCTAGGYLHGLAQQQWSSLPVTGYQSGALPEGPGA